MAKVSAHGKELGTIEGLRSSKRYMSDGVVLRNDGFGWKLHGKVKPGLSPDQAFAQAKARHESALANRPQLAAYRKELHAMAGLCKHAYPVDTHTYLLYK